MLSDYVLELWSVTAEREPSRGWSVTALRTQQHQPDLCALRQSSAPFLERASSGDLQGDVLAGRSWGCYAWLWAGGYSRAALPWVLAAAVSC